MGLKFPDDLTEHTTPDPNDSLPIHDSTAQVTKFIKLANLVTNGSGVIPKGGTTGYASEAALIAAEGSVEAYWWYYNTTDKKSYIRNSDNTEWVLVTVDGKDAPTITTGSEFNVDVDFETVTQFKYKLPRYVVFHTVEYENGAPTIDPPLETGMAPYDYLTINPTTTGMVKVKGEIIDNFVDSTPPVIDSFDIPSTSSSLTVNVTLTGHDDSGSVKYWIVRESSATPTAGDGAWSTTKPTTFTFGTDGAKTLYAWAKDNAGNVSTGASDTCTITLASPNYLEFVFDSVASAQTFLQYHNSDPLTVGNWNAALGLTGGQAFTSVEKVGTAAYRLRGSSGGITIPMSFAANFTTLLQANDAGGFVGTIEASAFQNCTGLTLAHFDSATTIKDHAFYYCTALTDLIASNTTTLEGSAFHHCTANTIFDFHHATAVGDNCFRETAQATEIHLEGLVSANTSLGGTNGSNNVFINTNNTGTVHIYVPTYFSTNNGGNWDGDLLDMYNWNVGHYQIHWV